MSESTLTNGATMALPLTVRAQYIKDLSFENPNPIAAFTMEDGSQPNISVGIQAKAQGLGEKNFEVVLEIRVDAKREKEEVIFVAELSYGGIITLGEEVTEEEMGTYIMVEAPRLLFPFARNWIADVIRDGGYPPLMLAPVDFAALYADQQKNAGQKPH